MLKEAIVEIVTENGHQIFVDDERAKITIRSRQGLTITLDDETETISLTGPNIDLKSSGNLTLEAAGAVFVRAATFDLSTDVVAEVKSGGDLVLAGSLIKIN